MSGSTTCRPTGSPLDDKRNPVEAKRFARCPTRWGKRTTSERKRARTDQSFCVPKAEYVAQGYDLSLNRYKEIVHDDAGTPAPAGNYRRN